MAEAVLLAVTKIGSAVGDGPAKALINKLSEKVQALKELPSKVDLIFMGKVIQQIGTVYLTDELVKSWIGEVQKVAYRVEDVVDKYLYHLLQLEEEGFLKKYFVKGTHYAIVFSNTADEVAAIEGEIQQVIQMKEQWLQPSQLFFLEYKGPMPRSFN
jgi:disease resistance protein RPM1